MGDWQTVQKSKKIAFENKEHTKSQKSETRPRSDAAAF